MAKICKLCTRGTTRGATRSHSNIQAKKWVGVNVQPMKLFGQSVSVCTRCAKTLKKMAKEVV